MRSYVYKKYAKKFNVNLDEIELPLEDYPTLSDFFARSLKPGARTIDKDAILVSPSDGKVVSLGPVINCKVDQVKGTTYDLQDFIGEFTNDTSKKNFNCKDYTANLLDNKGNILHLLTIYLSPGDYHRFHSPADWTIKLRRHFQGTKQQKSFFFLTKLLS